MPKMNNQLFSPYSIMSMIDTWLLTKGYQLTRTMTASVLCSDSIHCNRNVYINFQKIISSNISRYDTSTGILVECFSSISMHTSKLVKSKKIIHLLVRCMFQSSAKIEHRGTKKHVSRKKLLVLVLSQKVSASSLTTLIDS
jgi:hypothetical protein